MKESLSDVLGEYMQRSHYSSGQLAALSGESKRTIVNWVDGTTKKPQKWQGLVKLAAVLHLNEEETNRLLQAAQHSSLPRLQETLEGTDDLALLAPWLPDSPPPFQPPRSLATFVGREREMERLAEALLQGRFVNVCNVRGMGGVGKTAVAIHLAYQLKTHFPDGVLWANLATSDIMTILNTFATTYGKDVSQLTNESSRSTFVRGLLANKQVLIILDDAQNSHQLEMLLPPNKGKTAVIITTRHDLAATDGFKRLEIKPFTPKSGHSLQLFTEFLGKPHVRRHKQNLIEIGEILGHLPLALTIAAGRLKYMPEQTIDHFLSQIQQQDERLDQLIREDRGVRLSFDLSYEALEAKTQQFFATLGLFGGDNFSVEAVTAVTKLPTNSVIEKLNELIRLSLVQEELNNRYSLHPLLRDYAREKISQKEMFTRMVNFFVAYIGQNEFEYEKLDVEVSNILAALETAVSQNLAAPLIQGIDTLYPFLEMRGLHETAEKYLEQAVQAAKASNDTAGAAQTLSNLGHLAYLKADYAQANIHLHAGLDKAHQAEIPDIHSRILYTLAAILIDQGQYPQAESYLLEALTLARRSEEVKVICDILQQLGKVVAHGRGDYDQVEIYLKESYRLAQQIGDQTRIGDLLVNFGTLAYERGQWQQAETYFLDGINLFREIGNLRGEVNLLNNLGVIAQGRGYFAKAETYFHSGLIAAKKINMNDTMVLINVNLGEVCLAQEKFETAINHLQQAISIAREIGNLPNLSYALSILGAVAVKQGGYDAAETYLQEGLSLAHKTNNPWSLFTAFRWRGELHLAQKQFHKAKVVWIQARDAAQEAGMEPLVGIALYGLARLNFAQDNFHEAYRLGENSLIILKRLDYHLHNEITIWLNSFPDFA